jgi:hypothetical protein
MGNIDRAVRAFLVAPVLIILAVAVFGVGSVAGVIALIVAAVMLLTAAVGNCPLYSVLGVSTGPRDEGRVSVSR